MKIPERLQGAYEELSKGLQISSQKIEIEVVAGISISQETLAHIMERRGRMAKSVVYAIALVLSRPNKIVDNSSKRKDSFIYARQVGNLHIAVVVAKTKTPGKSRVVSAFLMDSNSHRKLVDISGRTEGQTNSSI